MVVVVLLFCSKLSGNQPSENRRLQSIIRSKMVKLDLKTDYYWLPLTPLKNLKWCFYSKQNQHVSVCKQPYWAYLKLTHGVNNLPNLPLPAIAYYINTLDSQSSGRNRGWQTFLHVVDIFYKSTTDPSFKNLQLNGFSGETLKLNLEFLCNAHIT